MAVATDFCLI